MLVKGPPGLLSCNQITKTLFEDEAPEDKIYQYQEPFLLTWINLNTSMDN